MNNRRIYERIPYHEAVGVQKGENPPSGSVAKDLSLGGVQINVGDFIPLNTVVNLQIHLTNPARTVPIKGRVAWVREVPQSERYDVGIEFLPDKDSTAAIQHYISSRRFQPI